MAFYRKEVTGSTETLPAWPSWTPKTKLSNAQHHWSSDQIKLGDILICVEGYEKANFHTVDRYRGYVLGDVDLKHYHSLGPGHDHMFVTIQTSSSDVQKQKPLNKITFTQFPWIARLRGLSLRSSISPTSLGKNQSTIQHSTFSMLRHLWSMETGYWAMKIARNEFFNGRKSFEVLYTSLSHISLRDPYGDDDGSTTTVPGNFSYALKTSHSIKILSFDIRPVSWVSPPSSVLSSAPGIDGQRFNLQAQHLYWPCWVHIIRQKSVSNGLVFLDCFQLLRGLPSLDIKQRHTRIPSCREDGQDPTLQHFPRTTVISNVSPRHITMSRTFYQ